MFPIHLLKNVLNPRLVSKKSHHLEIIY